jgi:hypothetical protein
MALFKSQFQTGWIASGNSEKLLLPEEKSESQEEETLIMLAQEVKHFSSP